MPAVVEHDDAVIDRQRVDVVGEVLLGAAESVDQEEPGASSGPVATDASRTPSSTVTIRATPVIGREPYRPPG